CLCCLNLRPPRAALFPYTTLFRSINAGASEWFGDDLAALGPLVAAGVAGAMLPKAEGAGALQQVAAAAGPRCALVPLVESVAGLDRKSTRLNSSHVKISYAVFCLK